MDELETCEICDGDGWILLNPGEDYETMTRCECNLPDDEDMTGPNSSDNER